MPLFNLITQFRKIISLLRFQPLFNWIQSLWKTNRTTPMPQNVSPINPDYQYNYTFIEPVAMAETLPKGENFSFPWLKLVGAEIIKLVINTLKANRSDAEAFDDTRKLLTQMVVKTAQEEAGNSLPKPIQTALVGILQGGQVQRDTSDIAPRSAATDAPSPELTTSSLDPHPVQILLPPRALAMESTPRSAMIGQESSPGPVKSSLNSPGVDIAFTPQAEELASTESGVQVALEVESAIDDLVQDMTLEAESLEAPESASIRGLNLPTTMIIPNLMDKMEGVMKTLLKSLGEPFLKSLAQNILEKMKEQAPAGVAQSLDDYRKLFSIIPLPEIADTFTTDEMFAFLRVAGPNPVMLKRFRAFESHFPVTNSQYQAVMGTTDSLQEALNQGRLYWVDYKALDGAVNGTFAGELIVQKYAYAPMALFAVPPQQVSDRKLRPIAIQTGQDPTQHPIITPATGDVAWLMAKTLVQVADANVHEAVVHLAQTHLVVEPFVLATHRQLPTSHPLFILLTPHFQGTLAINNAAQQLLVAPKGGVNQLLAPTIDNARVLAVQGVQAFDFNASMLRKRLADRGVDDTNALPIYPYRDDALLVWDAIQAWVKDYLGVYYSSDAAVQQDLPLQVWAQELIALDGGRLNGFGETPEGQIQTLAYLVDVITLVIFTASAQHAAVNFPQLSVMSYAPAMPTAGYQPPRSIGPGSTEQDFLALLPPLEQAQLGLNLLHLLGSIYFTQLGQYERGHFADPRVAPLLKTFQTQLTTIETTISQRNLNRPQYDTLKPSKIPQSINI